MGSGPRLGRTSLSAPPNGNDETAGAVEVIGSGAAAAGAGPFATGVGALLERYAAIVETNGLCPYLRDLGGGLGAVFVVLDRELDLELAVRATRSTASRVIHVVFPCAPRESSRAFERFCNHVATRIRDDGRALVHAAFHPAMEGGRESSHRLVGLLRRSPDPFLQLVPSGIQVGGTMMAGDAPGKIAALEPLFERLMIGDALDRLLAQLAELHAARDRLGSFDPRDARATS